MTQTVKRTISTLGTHHIIELMGCNKEILDSSEKLEQVFLEAARLAKATIIMSKFHHFSPFGVSGMIIIAESHFSVHAWPAEGYAAVDIFTCGKIKSRAAIKYITKELEAQNYKEKVLLRGI